MSTSYILLVVFTLVACYASLCVFTGIVMGMMAATRRPVSTVNSAAITGLNVGFIGAFVTIALINLLASYL